MWTYSALVLIWEELCLSLGLSLMSPSVPLEKKVPENRTGSNCYHHCLQAEPSPPSHSWQASGSSAGFWKLHDTGNILYILSPYFIPVASLLMSTLTHKAQTSLREEGRDFRDCSLYSTNVFAVLPFTRIEKGGGIEAAEKLPHSLELGPVQATYSLLLLCPRQDAPHMSSTWPLLQGPRPGTPSYAKANHREEESEENAMQEVAIAWDGDQAAQLKLCVPFLVCPSGTVLDTVQEPHLSGCCGVEFVDIAPCLEEG